MERVMDQSMPRKAIKKKPHVHVAKLSKARGALDAWRAAMTGWLIGKDKSEKQWAELRRAQHDKPRDATTRARSVRLRMQKASRRANRGGKAVRHSVQR